MKWENPLSTIGGTIICAFTIVKLENNIQGLMRCMKDFPEHKISDIQDYDYGDKIGFIVIMRPKTIFDRIKQHIQSLLNKR